MNANIMKIMESKSKNPEGRLSDLYNCLKKGIERKYTSPFKKITISNATKRDLFADNGANDLSYEELNQVFEYLVEEMFGSKDTIEKIADLKNEKNLSVIKGIYEVGENFQREIELGYAPTINICWGKMGLRPYNFNERFEEICGRSIHDCMSELEDGLGCPEYDDTIEKMQQEFETVEIEFDRPELRSGEYKVWTCDDPDFIDISDYAIIEGVKVVNTTPHPINFKSEKTGKEYQVKGHYILNARPVEKLVETRNGIQYFKTVFEPTSEGIDFLDTLFGDFIVVGSIIAAQAYAGRVVAMTPAKGYERVPPAQKRMNLFKYTTF